MVDANYISFDSPMGTMSGLYNCTAFLLTEQDYRKTEHPFFRAAVSSCFLRSLDLL